MQEASYTGVRNILASKEDIPSEANNPRKSRGSNRGSDSRQKSVSGPDGRRSTCSEDLLRGTSQVFLPGQGTILIGVCKRVLHPWEPLMSRLPIKAGILQSPVARV